MPVQTTTRTVATPAEIEQLGALVAEPECALTDPPLHVPNAAGVLLALLLLSSGTPKESRK
ncbi:hypothetical protein LZG04_04930 [Saccharothrix sp. S26]|uniref:hypothetical protein n=1 Tax=Saccharothrix sp. S26 TaxID=2907215 RepID=UPI001F43CB25|nr:hypothetical protein [Saccharothrix sp. S26]MCE6994158.1 hypothetical protein [Saccharothrix sp. S26]